MVDVSKDPIQVVFATDKNYVRPTCCAILSLLEKTEHPVEIKVLGVGIEPEDADQIHAIGKVFTNAKTTVHAVNPKKLQHAVSRFAHISTATYLRLLIPNYFSGRVIYLDTDLFVRHDIGELWASDLNQHTLGAVRDSHCTWELHLILNPPPAMENVVRRARMHVSQIAKRTGVSAPQKYFNAGVLVIDVDQLKADPELLKRFQDIEGASADGLFMDNDWLNIVFKDNVAYLPHHWNALKANAKMNAAHVPENVRRAYFQSMTDPAIVHFTGPYKPWNPDVPSDHPTFAGNAYVHEYLDVLKRTDALLTAI
ncbi:MAG: glycosyltransferase family 8 protein [Planktomarina sp.]